MAAPSGGQLEELKEAFEIYDEEKVGSITPAQLGAMLRGVGTNPTDQEVEEIAAQVEKGGKLGQDSVIEAYKIMFGRMASKDSKGDCLAAFKVFDEHKDGTMAAGCANTRSTRTAFPPSTQCTARTGY